MNPIIILGMDNTGKTTLTQKLVKRLKELETDGGRKLDFVNLNISPGPGEKKKLLDWVSSCIVSKFDTKYGIEVFDRFTCIDQQIYGPICRGDNDMEDYQDWTAILMNLLPADMKPYVIYCRPHISKIIGFEDGREQMEGVVENAEKLLHRYDEMYFTLHSSSIRNNVHIFNYEVDEIDNLIMNYLEFVNNCQVETTKIVKLPNFKTILDLLEKDSMDIKYPLDRKMLSLFVDRKLLRDAFSSAILNKETELADRLKKLIIQNKELLEKTRVEYIQSL